MLNEIQQSRIISLLQAEPIVVKEIVTDADGNDTIVKTTLTGEDQANKTLQGLYSAEEIVVILTTTKEFIKVNKVKLDRQFAIDTIVKGEYGELFNKIITTLPDMTTLPNYAELFDNDNLTLELTIGWHKEIVKKVVMAKAESGVFDAKSQPVGSQEIETTFDMPVYSWLFRPIFVNKNIVKITKKSTTTSDGTPKETKKNQNPDGYDTWVKALKALGREYFTNNSIDGMMKSGVNARVVFRKILKDHPEYLSTLTVNGHAITAEDLA
jgi:hypothetical protein